MPGAEFDLAEHAYVPILLTRRGERIAVRESTQTVKDRLAPLWVVAPVPWDFENEIPAKTVDEHVAGLADDLVRDWGHNTAYVDTTYLSDDLLANGRHPMVEIVARAQAKGLPLVPVTGPDRPAAHHRATIDTLGLGGPGLVCLRIPRGYALEWQLAAAARRWDVSVLLTTLGVSPAQVDIVIDFADEVDEPLAAASLMRTILATMPHQMDWRSVTFAGTSMPASMQGVPTMDVTPFARGEWETYGQLVGGTPIARPVRFGDYGVQHPEIADVDPRFMRIFSQIRYVTSRGWLIARGLELRTAGYDHVHDLTAMLVRHPLYAGPQFSSGDHWLTECAAGNVSSGNPEVWRRVSTNHHLAHVTTALAASYGLPTP